MGPLRQVEGLAAAPTPARAELRLPGCGARGRRGAELRGRGEVQPGLARNTATALVTAEALRPKNPQEHVMEGFSEGSDSGGGSNARETRSADTDTEESDLDSAPELQPTLSRSGGDRAWVPRARTSPINLVSAGGQAQPPEPKPAAARRRPAGAPLDVMDAWILALLESVRSDSGGLLERLRARFRAGAVAGVGTAGRASRAQLFEQSLRLLEGALPLDGEDLELLCEVVKRCYAEVDLGLGGLGVDEWVHFVLLRSSAPSHPAAVGLNRRLCRALGKDAELLPRLHEAFRGADAWGLLHRPCWEEAFRLAGLPGQPENATDLEEDGALDYYEFVSYVLGAVPTVVELALYDLSQGMAKWVPPSLLGGHRFEGIWHSGVRVFGREFWYGGVILESMPEEAPFGKPTRLLQLGKTLRSKEEFLEFLRNDVYVEYNPGNYDVLRRNCNHFSDELVQFLLHGKQVPEEVLMQPEWARNARFVRTLRPFMNRWLGGFGDAIGTANANTGSPSGSPCHASRIDDLTEEWRSRLCAGDIVLHRARFASRPWAVRIVRLLPEHRSRTAEVALLRPTAAKRQDVPGASVRGSSVWDWEAVRQQVPLRELWPMPRQADGSASSLRVGVAQPDSRSMEVLLRRRCGGAARACCPRGHGLKAEPQHVWFRQAPACGLCAARASSSRGPRLLCTRCGFAACGPCLAEAAALPGGGAFADLLSRPLAEALLEQPKWLKFTARAYFLRSDHNGAGCIDRVKARRLVGRLAAELQGQSPEGPLRRRGGAAATADLVTEALRVGGFDCSETVEIDEKTFVEDFFGHLLSQALAWPAPAGPAAQPEANRRPAEEAGGAAPGDAPVDGSGGCGCKLWDLASV